MRQAKVTNQATAVAAAPYTDVRGSTPYADLGIDKDDNPKREFVSPMSYRRDKTVPKRVKLVAFTFDHTKAYPKVGQGVAICHRTQVNRQGDCRMMRTDVVHRTVTAVYMGDADGYHIRDNCGESWLVRPASIGSSQWETFVPGDKVKVLK